MDHHSVSALLGSKKLGPYTQVLTMVLLTSYCQSLLLGWQVTKHVLLIMVLLVCNFKEYSTNWIIQHANTEQFPNILLVLPLYQKRNT